MALDEAVRENENRDDLIVSAAFVETLLRKIQLVYHRFDSCMIGAPKIPLNFPRDNVEKCISTNWRFPGYPLLLFTEIIVAF